MKPTQSILILLTLFVMFSCEDNSVETLVCDEGLSDIYGVCTLVCDEGLTDVDGVCVVLVVCQSNFTICPTWTDYGQRVRMARLASWHSCGIGL